MTMTIDDAELTKNLIFSQLEFGITKGFDCLSAVGAIRRYTSKTKIICQRGIGWTDVRMDGGMQIDV